MDVFQAVTRDARAFLVAAAVNAAERLGVFDALAAPLDGEALAARLGVAPRRLRALLDVLVLDGALARDGTRYTRARMDPPHPVPDGGWGRLAEVIRRDRPLPPDESPEALARFHAHLAAVGAAPARELAARIAPHLSGGELLDAGGGAGTYTAALLDAVPTARATLVDLPPVVALAREALARFEGRVRFLDGDLLHVPLPRCRAALLANLLHLHPEPTCAALVARVAAAVEPGGLVILKDLAIAPDRSGPEASVLFALNMALYTEGGDVHDEARLAAWLRGGGVDRTDTKRLPSAPDSWTVIGRKLPFLTGS